MRSAGVLGKVDLDDEGDDTYVIIDLTVYGSVNLRMQMLPGVTSKDWNRLKRARTKTLTLSMVNDCEKWIHADSEVELWSIDGQAFSWRRDRRLAEAVKEEEDEEESMSSSLRGGQVQANSKQGRRRLEAFELKFEAVIPTKCYVALCQTNTLVAFGSESPFRHIDECFAASVDDGKLALQLKEVSDQMSLQDYLGTFPGATNGELTYANAVRSDREGITWSPSELPTYNPTYVTQMPTADVYWPDAMNTVCKSGDDHPEFNTNFFGRLEDCCKFPWIDDYETCMTRSFEANKPTRHPTRMPTPKPTKVTTTPRPTRLPDDSPSRPAGPSAPTGGGGGGAVVYYPDLTLGVCKFDGRHGNTPYQFSTAEACCTNQWMDYDKCMAYADPNSAGGGGIKFYPDIYAGFCKSDGGHIGLDERMVFGSAAACCDNVWMVYRECMTKNANPPSSPTLPTYSGPSPPSATPRLTPRVTPRPTAGRPVDASQVRGIFYPKFDAGLCLLDGNHAGQAYTFDTLAQCCTNGVMNYGDCVASSMAVYDPNSGSNSVGGGGGGGSGGGTQDTTDCSGTPTPRASGCARTPSYTQPTGLPSRTTSSKPTGNAARAPSAVRTAR